LWQRDKNDCIEDEYKLFYKNLTNESDEYMAMEHFKVDGNFTVKGILFIPKKRPFDSYQNTEQKRSIKIYSKNVFIMDKCDDIIPNWLNFVKGVIDSEDIPLTVSREMLQHSSTMKTLGKVIMRKSLDMLDILSKNEEDFLQFYYNYSKNIKMGIYENSVHKEKLCKLLRYQTNNSDSKLISFDKYIQNMSEEETNIYYISGESIESIINSPFLENLNKIIKKFY